MMRNFISIFENAVREQHVILNKLIEQSLLQEQDKVMVEKFANLIIQQHNLCSDCERAMREIRQDHGINNKNYYYKG